LRYAKSAALLVANLKDICFGIFLFGTPQGSSCRIDQLRSTENALAADRVWTLFDRGTDKEVDRSAEEAFELLGDGDEMESWGLPGLELDEKIDVTVGSKVVPERRAKDGETGDAIGAAEVGEAVFGDDQVQVHEHCSYVDAFRYRLTASPASEKTARKSRSCGWKISAILLPGTRIMARTVGPSRSERGTPRERTLFATG